MYSLDEQFCTSSRVKALLSCIKTFFINGYLIYGME